MRARTPGSLLVAAVVCAGCAGDDVDERRNVVYDDRFAATRLDVYRPADVAAEPAAASRPAVLYIHGGSWNSGSKDHHADHARRLAASGYVAFSIDYRLVPDGAYPHMFQDVACALAFVRDRAADYGVDPDRIAVAGYSAGAHLASLLAVNADEPDFLPDCAVARGAAPAPPAAVIAGAGPHDLHWRVDAVERLLGGTIEDVPERYERASPVRHVDGDEPPYLFIHGTDDWVVPLEQSRVMRDALRASGVDARLLELAGVGHLVAVGTGSARQELGIIALDPPEAWLATMDFLADTVGAP